MTDRLYWQALEVLAAPNTESQLETALGLFDHLRLRSPRAYAAAAAVHLREGLEIGPALSLHGIAPDAEAVANLKRYIGRAYELAANDASTECPSSSENERRGVRAR